jgi:hypothetical protein
MISPRSEIELILAHAPIIRTFGKVNVHEDIEEVLMAISM